MRKYISILSIAFFTLFSASSYSTEAVIDDYYACVDVTFSCGHQGSVCGNSTTEIVTWIMIWDDEICG